MDSYQHKINTKAATAAFFIKSRIKTLLFVLMLWPGFIWSQTFSAGIKGGLNFSKATTNFNYQTVKTASGYHAGLYGRLSFLGFLVQPEVIFNQKGSVFELNKDSISSFTLNYLEVPVLFGATFFDFARVYAGPNFTVLLSAIRESDFKDPNYTENVFNKYPVSGIIGAGVSFWKLSIDARYDFSISKIGNEIATTKGTIDFGSRIHTFQISLGYRLVKL